MLHLQLDWFSVDEKGKTKNTITLGIRFFVPNRYALPSVKAFTHNNQWSLCFSGIFKNNCLTYLIWKFCMKFTLFCVRSYYPCICTSKLYVHPHNIKSAKYGCIADIYLCRATSPHHRATLLSTRKLCLATKPHIFCMVFLRYIIIIEFFRKWIWCACDVVFELWTCQLTVYFAATIYTCIVKARFYPGIFTLKDVSSSSLT